MASKMESMNKWYFPRPQLAQKYLTLFDIGPGEPLAIFQHRRTGKTSFLKEDIAPAAERMGWLPVYIDLWRDRGNAASSINYDLACAIADLDESKSGLVRDVLNAKVKSVKVLGADISFAEDAPKQTAPDDAYLKISYLLRTLVRQAEGRKILLAFDEFQSLAIARDADKVVSALRAALTDHRGQVYALFTGSSQNGLTSLFARHDAPLYGFSSLLTMPRLGSDFIAFNVQRFKAVTGLVLDQDRLMYAFEQFDYRPAALRDLIFDLLKDDSVDIDSYLKKHLQSKEARLDYVKLWDEIKPLDQLVLKRLAVGKKVYSKEALEFYSNHRSDTAQVSASSAQSALKRLRNADIVIDNGPKALDTFESDGFKQWVITHAMTSKESETMSHEGLETSLSPVPARPALASLSGQQSAPGP